MRRSLALVATAVTTALASVAVASPAVAATPLEGHVSVEAGEPFLLCGDLPVTYTEETDYRMVLRHRASDGVWWGTMFTSGWFAFTDVETGRRVQATYHKADRDIQVLASDAEGRTLLVMNNRTEVWTDDTGARIGAVHGPISYQVTVSWAGTPSDLFDDYWLVPPDTYTVHGDWKFDDGFCDAVRPALVQ